MEESHTTSVFITEPKIETFSWQTSPSANGHDIAEQIDLGIKLLQSKRATAFQVTWDDVGQFFVIQGWRFAEALTTEQNINPNNLCQ